ncbi:sorting nexin-10A-like, partial [Clarias magur]
SLLPYHRLSPDEKHFSAICSDISEMEDMRDMRSLIKKEFVNVWVRDPQLHREDYWHTHIDYEICLHGFEQQREAHSILLQKHDEMKRGRDEMKRGRDEMKEERDEMKEERDEMKEERDEVKVKHDEMKVKHDEMKVKHDEMKENNIIERIHNGMKEKNDRMEKNNVMKEMHDVMKKDIQKTEYDQHMFAEMDKVKKRARCLGNITFFCELFKRKMVTEQTMHECISKLLKNPSMDNLDCYSYLICNI